MQDEPLSNDGVHLIAALSKWAGLLDKIAYRNLCWKLEFEEKLNAGGNAEEIMQDMSERYHLSVSSIDLIVYPRGEKKDQTDKIMAQVLKVKKTTRRVHYNRRRRS